jgi:hypothetical protein
MSDSGTTEPERKPQRAFSLAGLGAILLLTLAIGLFDRWLDTVPNRAELGPATIALRFTPVELDELGFGAAKLAGAWEVRGGDPRFGGISGLALDRGDFLALSDSGVLVRFAPPRGAVGKAVVSELPGGPGDGRFKRNRDSEALARDPQGRGWWVAFENRHELWLYDEGFGRVLDRIELGQDRWRANKGIEAIVAERNGLLLFPESGQSVLRAAGSKVREAPIGNARGRVSDAAALALGLSIAVERRLTPVGFGNSLVWVHQNEKGYRFGRRIRLPLRLIDNVEGIAVQRLPGGQLRLWLMTDDNHQPPLRTLLIALDWPAPKGAWTE